MRDKIINNILIKMGSRIRKNDLEFLGQVLVEELRDVQIKKETTELAEYNDSMRKLKDMFLATLLIENKSKRTIEQYNLHLTQFAEFFTYKEVKDIDATDIRNFLYAYKQSRGISNISLNNKRSAISSFFSWLADEEYIDKDPTRKIKKIKVTKKKKKAFTADENGQTPVVDLPAPPVEYSMSPSENQPYSEYNLKIHSDEYKPVTISGAQILSGVEGLQPVSMIPEETHTPTEEHPIVIGPHTLWGNYPPKIAESEIKPVNESGEIVLSRVVIPEYIIVHDGPVGDKTAQNYYVRYKDYIKNVAACEIYSTWPRATLEANILAIMSFTLNRVYTEWYRNKGHDFTITSSTAYDHKFIPGKTTYNSINTIVDEIFADYLSRPNVRQPILTQYCDGKKVSCPEWMALL